MFVVATTRLKVRVMSPIKKKGFNPFFTLPILPLEFTESAGFSEAKRKWYVMKLFLLDGYKKSPTLKESSSLMDSSHFSGFKLLSKNHLWEAFQDRLIVESDSANAVFWVGILGLGGCSSYSMRSTCYLLPYRWLSCHVGLSANGMADALVKQGMDIISPLMVPIL